MSIDQYRIFTQVGGDFVIFSPPSDEPNFQLGFDFSKTTERKVRHFYKLLIEGNPAVLNFDDGSKIQVLGDIVTFCPRYCSVTVDIGTGPEVFRDTIHDLIIEKYE